VSGGADSDILIDICTKCDNDHKVKYVWYDTGLEYQATKDHLTELEKKYGIEIIRYKANKPIPLSCKQRGQPFLNKKTADMIDRLQLHGFRFSKLEDGNKSFEELYQKYPNCKSALEWWCNRNKSVAMNVEKNRYLKEFMMENPPQFRISSMCCTHAKKNTAKKSNKELNADLSIIGIRRAEKGIRAAVHKTCFEEHADIDLYMPLFWYNDADREQYAKHMGVTHSKCYTEYGLKRTGCAGCPFGRDFEYELEVIHTYEDRLYIAVNNIFGDSYEYTRNFKKFQQKMNDIYGTYPNYKRIMSDKNAT